MAINGSICKPVSEKSELFDSERDMADIADDTLPLKVLTINKMISSSKTIDTSINIAKIR